MEGPTYYGKRFRSKTREVKKGLKYYSYTTQQCGTVNHSSRRLSEIYDVEFLFTNVEGYNRTYGTDLSKEIPGMEGIYYRIVPNKLNGLGAIKRALGEYAVFVGGSWDTPTDAFETLLYSFNSENKGETIHSMEGRLGLER